MSKKFILNKVGQKHYYNDLVTLVQGLDPNEVIDVLYALGLDEFVDPEGGLAPYLSADIVSSEERFLNPAVQHNITLTGKLYNFFREDSERAETWSWTRDSGNPTEDALWFKDTKEIVLTDSDLTDRVRAGKVFFHLSVKVGDEYYTDVIDFSTVISLNSVQIQASHSLFLGGTPSEISLLAKVSEGIYTNAFKWFVNDVLKATTSTYKLPSSIVDSGKVANIRLEVLDVKGRLYTDFISIPKISNGSQGEPGVPGQSGAPGVPGSRGPMPRMLEWRVGYTYYRNAEYRDYIYYRSTNPTYDGWYCVKDVPVNLYNTTATGIEEFRAVANSGSPDTAIFQKQEFTDSQIFGTIIAEGANLAGFIFRNQQLFSQTGMDTVNETPQFSNLLLNGLLGFLKFAEKLHIDKDGITFFDTSKRPRIRFGFEDTEEGIPYLRFLAADGTILWEAGKDYTKWITQGTVQPSWSSQHAYASLMLGDDKDAVPSLSSIKSAIDSMVTDRDGVINRLRLLSEADAAYWKATSMPSKSKTVNRGDTASGQDLYVGWYEASALRMLSTAEVAAGTLTGLVADGWYVGNFERGYGAVPGYELYGGIVGDILEFKAYAVYILKGQVYREHSYVVHQQTENI